MMFPIVLLLISVSSISSETVMIMPKPNQENAAINSAIVIIFETLSA